MTFCTEWKSAFKQQVRNVGNKFLNSVEISAQEAVYVVLQLPMRKASRSVVFINTSPPAERVELLKPSSEIENLSDDCEEIQSSGLLKRYIERPECMQNITLADWAAWCDSCGKKGNRKTNKKCDVDNLLLENHRWKSQTSEPTTATERGSGDLTEIQNGDREPKEICRSLCDRLQTI